MSESENEADASPSETIVAQSLAPPSAEATVASRNTTRIKYFAKHDGFISKGGDLHTQSMTVSDAKETAASLEGCCGFCFRGEDHEGIVNIMFKSKFDNTVGKNKWTSYEAVRTSYEDLHRQSSVPDDLTECSPTNGTPRTGQDCTLFFPSPRADTPRAVTPRGDAGAVGFGLPEAAESASEAVSKGVETAERQLPDRLRICVLGGTEIRDARTEVLVTEVAQRMAEFLKGRALFVTGGMPGVQACFAKGVGESESLFNLLLDGEASDYEAGHGIRCGSCAAVRSLVLSQLADVYISFEGDAGTAQEASSAHNRGAFVLPVKCTGGASGGLHDFPAAALKRPEDCASVGQWSRLVDWCAPEITAAAIVGIVSRRLGIMTPDAMPLELLASMPSAQTDFQGRYESVPGQLANGVPLYKHASEQRYLYSMPSGAWGFGNADVKAAGFGANAFIYHPAVRPGMDPSSLAREQWKVYNGRSHVTEPSFAVAVTKHGGRLGGHWRSDSGAVMVIKGDLVCNAGETLGTVIQAAHGCTLRRTTGEVYEATFGAFGELLWPDGQLWRRVPATPMWPPPLLPGCIRTASGSVDVRGMLGASPRNAEIALGGTELCPADPEFSSSTAATCKRKGESVSPARKRHKSDA